MKLITSLGRWSVGSVTALYGVFFLIGGINAIAFLLGRPDYYHNLLLANGQVEAAADHFRAAPFIMLFNLGMGLFNISAAVFLINWRPKLFAVACSGVAVIATTLTVFGLASGEKTWSIFAWAWPFVPLALLAGAAYVLRLLNNRRTTPHLLA
ncbi:hypothetical protein [Asticcacaulis sp. MM231]|uniref:hypothetical protein n=1 Tax=Asticcacaulis sp. MM231 TaxID=3157666 RepID=UPI0032D56AAE